MSALKVLLVSPPSPALLTFPAKRLCCFTALQRFTNAPTLPVINLFKTRLDRNKLGYCNGDFTSPLGADSFGTVFLLFQEMGLTEDEAKLVFEKNPEIETKSFEFIRGRIQSLHSLGLNVLQLSSLIGRHPHVLTSGEVTSVMNFIHDDLENKVKPSQIAKLLAYTEPGFCASFVDKINTLMKHGIRKEQLPNILNQINLNKALSPALLTFPAKRLCCFTALQRFTNAPTLPVINLFKTRLDRNKLGYCNGDFTSPLGADSFGTVFLLFQEMGLTEDEAKLVFEKNPEIETKSFEFIRGRIQSLHSLGLNVLQLSSLIGRHPHVLTSGEVTSVMNFIHDDLENKVKPSQIAKLLAYTEPGFCASFVDKINTLMKHGIRKEQLPNILNQINLNKALLYKPVEEIDRLLTFLSCYGGIGIVVKRPTILNYDLDTQLAPRVGVLKKLSGDDDEATAVVIRRLPAVLLYSKEHMENQVEFMRSFAELTYDEIFRIISTYPNLMSSSRERKLGPRIKFLRDCGLDSRDIFRIASQSPLFLGLSFEGNLAFKLCMLVKIGYVYRTKELAFAMGAVTRTSVENLQEVIGLFLSYGFSFDDIVSMSTRHPQILQYNSRSLERKIEYLVEEMGREVGELLAFPAFLSYNLDKRIKPRYETRRKIVGEEMSINKLLSVSVERFARMGGMER